MATTHIRTLPERWRSNIGFITSTALIAQIIAGADDPVLTEPDAHLGEVKTELRGAKAEVARLKKEVERYRNRDDRSNQSVHSDVRSNSRSSETINVEATFYTAFCPTGCIGITATGLDVSNTIYTPEGYRVIAVDPSQISLGSLVRVTLADGSTFKAVASDTGGDIKGARIDVLVATRDEANRLGRQAATVEIINEGER
ncbi:3D domain-containing protein [Bacillus sp. FSL K6-3431]|uniref:3D domain-containing protein n=1 Tax=Bacillus sp. FSL K6-3431 TaxID=2921500 RepID=UPI0030FA96A0